MAAKYNVEWSQRALSDLTRIHDFLLEKWGRTKSEEFIELSMEFERYISKYPQAYGKSRRYRSCYLGLIHKNTTAVYKITGTVMYIVTVFDNRSKTRFR